MPSFTDASRRDVGSHQGNHDTTLAPYHCEIPSRETWPGWRALHQEPAMDDHTDATSILETPQVAPEARPKVPSVSSRTGYRGPDSCPTTNAPDFFTAHVHDRQIQRRTYDRSARPGSRESQHRERTPLHDTTTPGRAIRTHAPRSTGRTSAGDGGPMLCSHCGVGRGKVAGVGRQTGAEDASGGQNLTPSL